MALGSHINVPNSPLKPPGLYLIAIVMRGKLIPRGTSLSDNGCNFYSSPTESMFAVAVAGNFFFCDSIFFSKSFQIERNTIVEGVFPFDYEPNGLPFGL